MSIFLGHKGHSARKQFPVYIFNYTGCVPLEIRVCIRNTLGDRGRMDTHLSETALMAVCSSLGACSQACSFSCRIGFSKNSLSENSFSKGAKPQICSFYSLTGSLPKVWRGKVGITTIWLVDFNWPSDLFQQIIQTP